MAFRMNGGNNRRNDNNRNFDHRGYSNNANRQINPWDNNAGGGSNFRQGGGGVNNDVLSLASSLVNNLIRNNQPPSLLDLPQRSGGYGNNLNFGRFDDRNGRVSSKLILSDIHMKAYLLYAYIRIYIIYTMCVYLCVRSEI